MSQSGGSKNAWNRGRQASSSLVKSDESNNNGRIKTQTASAKNKFEEVQIRIQKSLEKHMQDDYESSSEEEELETENILTSLLKNYNSSGGHSEDLGRTQSVLENAFHSGAAVCLICITLVKRVEAIWSCSSCFGFFHLQCIQRWAKDSIAHQKLTQDHLIKKEFWWNCPKCRKEYEALNIPSHYKCFCGNTVDPVFQPWLVPHSCGETCNKPLQPECGHNCLLLCHPGPCPCCPKMIMANCFCGKGGELPVRCSKKEWSCSDICGKKLKCEKHICENICHKNECPPCPKTSLMPCQCKDQSRLMPCAELSWNCQKVCGKLLDCGEHRCEIICHKGDCGPCPRSLPRSCPCGKEVGVFKCTEEINTCGGTCSKLLDCGLHNCGQRCHQGNCGPCMEFLDKLCRCGLHRKEVPCQKEFLCETKCKEMRDCGVHYCNRKCCNGQCPPCYALCKKTLLCGKHKCEAVCHRGPCYPCQQTLLITCKKCNSPITSVPCGVTKRKYFFCTKSCKVSPDCHHPTRTNHKCHIGPCPPCKQICGKIKTCGHICKIPCHSKVLLTDPNYKPATPIDVAPVRIKSLECPECTIPVKVPCLGRHEILTLPCNEAETQPCGRACGRQLLCKNHFCTLPCHEVNSSNDTEAGDKCEICNEDCVAERPCTHGCPDGCHPLPCKPCTIILKLRCHCKLNFIYVKCFEWIELNEEEKLKKLSCGDQCPKYFSCGHRCTSSCHSGYCPGADSCKKRVKALCPCKRIKKDVPCFSYTHNQIIICDETCQAIKLEKELKELKEKEGAQLAEEKRKKEELELYEKKLQGGKRHNRVRRRAQEEKDKTSVLTEYKFVFLAVIIVIVSIGSYSMLY